MLVALAGIYQSSYSLSTSQFGALFTAYSLPNVVLVFFSGLLVDRFGVSLCAVGFNLCVLAGATVCALVPASSSTNLTTPTTTPAATSAFRLLLVGRVLIGVGGESIVATTLKMVSRSFASTEHINTAMAVNQAAVQLLGSSLPFLLLPALGSVDKANVAMVGVCLASLLAAVIYKAMERGCGGRCFGEGGGGHEQGAAWSGVSSREDDDEKTSLLGGSSSSSSSSRGREDNKPTPPSPSSHAPPLSALATLRRFPTSFWVLLLHVGLTSPVLWTFSDFGCLYLQEKFASTPTPEIAGKTMSLLYLGIVCAPFTALLIDRVGHRPLVQLVASSSVPFLFFLLDRQALSPAAALGCLGFVYGVTETNGFALVAVLVPEEVQGAAFGLVGCAISFALILEPWAVGVMREASGNFDMAMSMFFSVTALGAAVAGIIVYHTQTATNKQEVLSAQADCRL